MELDLYPLLAVDPGKSGGLAWMAKDYSIHCAAWPASPDAAVKLLKHIDARQVVIEKVGGFIQGSELTSSGAFTFGWHAGGPFWILKTLDECKVRYCSPQKWMRRLDVGFKKNYGEKWKKHLKEVAQGLYPDLNVTYATADALLILTAAIRGLI